GTTGRVIGLVEAARGLGAPSVRARRLAHRLGGCRIRRNCLGCAGGTLAVGAFAVGALRGGLGFGARVGIVVLAAFRLDQRLPVSNRNLIVVGMDFREREEPVPIAAVVDERGLK